MQTSVSMPFGWIKTFRDIASERRIPYSRLMCEVVQFYAEQHDIELPPAR